MSALDAVFTAPPDHGAPGRPADPCGCSEVGPELRKGTSGRRWQCGSCGEVYVAAGGAPVVDEPADAAVGEVADALARLAEERATALGPAADVVAVAHAAIEAAVAAARIRGGRTALASRLRPGASDLAGVRARAEQSARASERATRAAHDALDLAVVALGAGR